MNAALEQAKLAASLDPQSAVMQASLALRVDVLGFHDEARSAAERADALGLSGGLHMIQADLYFLRGDYAGALAEIRQVKDGHPDSIADFEHLIESVHAPMTTVVPDDSARAFAVYVARGDVDAAYALAETLAKQRGVMLDRLWAPAFKEFRSDPRFVPLMKSIGLTDYWRRYGWPDACRPAGEGLACG